MSKPAKGQGQREKESRKPAKGQGQREKEADNVLEGDDELFMTMTTQEKVAWEKMMKLRIESLKTNQVEFQKWRDTMTRRRMFVYSRVRKLYAGQMERFRFMLKMAETVKSIKDNKKDDSDDTHDNNVVDNSATNCSDGKVIGHPLHSNTANEENGSASNSEAGAQQSGPIVVVTPADEIATLTSADKHANGKGQTHSTATDSNFVGNNLPTISEEEVTNESPREAS